MLYLTALERNNINKKRKNLIWEWELCILFNLFANYFIIIIIMYFIDFVQHHI